MKIGSSDLDVSPLCLGGDPFGWTADEETSFAVLDAYAEAGGDFIDTADRLSAALETSEREGLAAYVALQAEYNLVQRENYERELAPAVARVALAWLAAQPAVATPLAGARNPAQLADLLPYLTLRLADDEIALPDQASAWAQ